LEQIQNRWPEWQAAWTADGIILGTHGRREEARAALETAMALGAHSPEVQRYLDEISAGAEGKPPDLNRLLLAQPSRD
jgi:predicted RNA polymerase sigma factor